MATLTNAKAWEVYAWALLPKPICWCGRAAGPWRTMGFLLAQGDAGDYGTCLAYAAARSEEGEGAKRTRGWPRLEARASLPYRVVG